jgi:hypothetical protein
MIVACVILSINEKYNQFKYTLHHCLCDYIIMTSSFATNVICNLSNAITSYFSCKCHLQLKINSRLIGNMQKKLMIMRIV